MRYRNALFVFCVALLACVSSAGAAQRGATFLIDSMDQIDQWTVSRVKETPTVKLALCDDREGRPGAAFSVKADVGRLSALAMRRIQPDEAWNRYDGLSFWVKGDGSENWANIRLQARNGQAAWVASFPLRQTEWHEVRLAWGDFVPVTARIDELGTAKGIRPAEIDRVGFGKEWNFNIFHKSPEISFCIDDLAFVRGVKSSRRRVPIGKLPPLSSVVRKLETGQPVTILTLGDSITWGTSAGGNDYAYPAVLASLLRERYPKAEITLVNRAIGGSTTSRGREWLMRDVLGIEADLITVMMGYNERPAADEDVAAVTDRYLANLVRYVEEVAGVMKKRPTCVLLAPTPGRQTNWMALDAYAQGVRELGKRHRNVTIADANAHMKQLGQDAYAKLMADEAHPNPEGQKVMAEIVFRAITGQAPARH